MSIPPSAALFLPSVVKPIRMSNCSIRSSNSCPPRRLNSSRFVIDLAPFRTTEKFVPQNSHLILPCWSGAPHLGQFNGTISIMLVFGSLRGDKRLPWIGSDTDRKDNEERYG